MIFLNCKVSISRKTLKQSFREAKGRIFYSVKVANVHSTSVFGKMKVVRRNFLFTFNKMKA